MWDGRWVAGGITKISRKLMVNLVCRSVAVDFYQMDFEIPPNFHQTSSSWYD
jgi:hypothetical protein